MNPISDDATTSLPPPPPLQNPHPFPPPGEETVAVDGEGNVEVSPLKKNLSSLLVPGSTFSTNNDNNNTDEESISKKFSLRIGPNYRWNKKKCVSGVPLYDLKHVDFVKTKMLIDDVSSIFDTSTVDFGPSTDTSVPAGFIVNVGMPKEEPSIFGSKINGECYTAIVYFSLSDAVRKELSSLENARPCVKLLHDWFAKANDDATFRGRFKTICVVDQREDLGLPGWCNQVSAIAMKERNCNEKVEEKRSERCYAGKQFAHSPAVVDLTSFASLARSTTGSR